MDRIITRTVEYNEETAEYVIEIPDEICKELGLNPGYVMTYYRDDGKVILRKRLEY
nr:MAG: hypothetical protein [Caudoviricetes sp.]